MSFPTTIFHRIASVPRRIFHSLVCCCINRFAELLGRAVTIHTVRHSLPPPSPSPPAGLSKFLEFFFSAGNPFTSNLPFQKPTTASHLQICNNDGHFYYARGVQKSDVCRWRCPKIPNQHWLQSTNLTNRWVMDRSMDGWLDGTQYGSRLGKWHTPGKKSIGLILRGKLEQANYFPRTTTTGADGEYSNYMLLFNL